MLRTRSQHLINDPALIPTLYETSWASNLPSEPPFTHLENEAKKEKKKFFLPRAIGKMIRDNACKVLTREHYQHRNCYRHDYWYISVTILSAS